MSMLKTAARSVIPEAVYDVIRRARQSRMTRTFSSYQVQHRYCGRDLKVHIADPVGAEWYDHPMDSVPEIEFLQRFDLRGKTIFDIGAHQCIVAMLLADLVGEQGKVVAVEANTHNHAVSLRNIALNNRSNVTCLKSLVSSGKVQVSIDGGLNGRARAVGSAAKTEILTVDQMTEQFGAPALVFLDIEGHEIEAFGGAVHTLTNTASHWFIELHGDEALGTYGHRNSDVFRFFDDKKFAFYKLEAGATQFTPLTRDTLPTDRCHVFFERL